MFLTGLTSEDCNEATFDMKQDAKQRWTCHVICQRWCRAAFPAGILSPLRGIFGLAWAIVRYTKLYYIVVELDIICGTVKGFS